MALSEENRDRIKDNLLPTEIAVGIHAGRALINNDGTAAEPEYRPEGYAINLAKRIESESRKGKFTHILLSEAARGRLHTLTDEPTYDFDKPFPIEPKGISSRMDVFEIKHHFLPTDWQDDKAKEVSRIYNKLPSQGGIDYVDLTRMAFEANPTNLWLAEERIALMLMAGHKKLTERQRENTKALRSAYENVLKEAQRIAGMHTRDPGLLAIWGFVAGEMRLYELEQQKYAEALKDNEKQGEWRWYLAYSMSAELNAKLGNDCKKDYDELPDADKEGVSKDRVQEIFCTFRKAREFSHMNAWILYDYGCELARWAHRLEAKKPSEQERKHRKEAIDTLCQAFSGHPDTVERAREEPEPYLERVRDDKKIQSFLSG